MILRTFFGGLLIIVGLLIALVAGLCAGPYYSLVFGGIPFVAGINLIVVGLLFTLLPKGETKAKTKTRVGIAERDESSVTFTRLSDETKGLELKWWRKSERLLPRLLMGLGSVIAILTTGYMVLVPHMGHDNTPTYLILLGLLIIAVGLVLRAKRNENEGGEK